MIYPESGETIAWLVYKYLTQNIKNRRDHPLGFETSRVMPQTALFNAIIFCNM